MALHLCAKLLVGMMIGAACISAAISLTDENEKHTTTDESSLQFDKIHSHRNPNVKSSIDKNGEIVKPGKKMIHRLIGGHLKHYRKVVDAKHEKNKSMWDDGLLMSSAGNGKEKKNGRNEDDDEKKTLSQQVKEGKYGLIQNEIYPNPPKRPGIISYLSNPEVPKDTMKNLGGLDEEEIWLAENHVLVLRGGKFPEHSANQGGGRQKWPPIDDYKAPERQIKIPSRPKVPPPFPVQLTEGGPIQIIRSNESNSGETATVDYDSKPYYSEDFLPGEFPFFPFSPNATFPELGYPGNFTEGDDPSFPYLDGKNNGTYLPLFSQGFQPPDGAIGHFYPPGAVFLPPPNNQTDYDEEDQSIYYPPPYSFYYQTDNSTEVPPGPLVPGIILPPPPNFFSLLDEKKTTTKGKNNKPQITTSLPNVKTTYLPPRKLTTKLYKSHIATTTPIPPADTIIPKTSFITTTPRPVVKMLGRTKCKNVTITSSTKPPRKYFSTLPYTQTTTPRTDESTTLTNPDYHNVQAEIENHVTDTGSSEKGRWPAIVSSTPVPLLAYYGTTPSSSEETNNPVDSVTIPIKSGISNEQPTRLPDQAAYYFYEETNDGVVGTTTVAPSYYKTTTESLYYNVEPIQQQQPKNQYYSVEMIPSQQTAKDYNIKLMDAVVKPAQTYQYSEPESVRNPIKYDENPRRMQGQRMLVETGPRYYQSIPIRSPPAIKPYYTTPRPEYYYSEIQEQQYDYRDEQAPEAKPVYQFSYEAAGYAKQRQQHIYQPQIQQGPTLYNDYQQTPNENVPYYDSESETLPEEQQVPQRVSYRGPQPVAYPTTTTRPNIVEATPNPQHAYYTKQDEQLLDDVTKQYFTIFGKKLPEQGIPNTTPLYKIVSSTTENPTDNVNTYVSNQYAIRQPPFYKTPTSVKVHYGDHTQRPYSLKDDTLVNYKNPLPPINPDSEFIPIAKPIAKPQTQYRIQNGNQSPPRIQDYRTQRIVQQTNQSPNNFVPSTDPQELNRQAYPAVPISLEDDIAVNYRNPRPPINPDAEFITPVHGQINHSNKAGSYFAYQLPGNGGHFYFLTPQAISQRQDANGGYLYPKPTGPRLMRRRHGPAEV